MTGRPIPALWAISYWAVAALLVGVLAFTGQMAPWVSPDTESWLAPDWSLDALGLPRFPLYGLILRGLGWDGGARLLPWLQDGSFILAAWALAQAVRRRGLSPAAALAFGLAPLLSCVMLLWGRAVLPDVWAEAALLAALAATITPGARHLAAAAMFGAVAYLLKPLLLPFIFGLPLILMLDRAGLRSRVRSAGALLLGLAAPFLLIATLRLAVLGDFNVVSFGSFQMSGMAALMLTPDTIPRLPAELRPAAWDIMARRDALTASGDALAVPKNAAGVRSFPSAAAGYFDLLARTYDDVLYGAVRPGQQPGESWVAFNARLQRLAVATVLAEPVDYAAWVAGALARLLGRLAVFNPGMILGYALILGGLLRRPPSPPRPGEMRLLLTVAGIHTAAAAMLTVLVTFPAARYIDCAGMMLAALPLYAGLRRLPGFGGRHNESFPASFNTASIVARGRTSVLSASRSGMAP